VERWEKIDAVHRMQNYIEQHIEEAITLHMVAQAAGYSPFHASRMFKELMGKTLFDYIRALRLSRAAVLLRDNNNIKIVDVAFDFIFDSHEGFTRAFTKQFGISPKNYMKNAPPIKLFMPNRIRDYYLRLQKGEVDMKQKTNSNTVFVQVVDRPDRKLILRRGIKATHYFDYCEEVGCDVWGILSSIKEAIYEPVGLWLPDSLKVNNTSTYAQGVELPADYTGIVPEGFEMIDLAACKMMVFQGQPFEDEKFEEAIAEVWEAMKSYDPRIYGFEWADDDAPRIQLEPVGYRGYIEARPVTPLHRG